MKIPSIVLAAFGAAFSTTAMASVYLEGGIGSTRASLDCNGTTACDKSGTGAKLVAGYKLSESFALEAGYQTFGTAKVQGAGITAKASASAITFGGAYREVITESIGITSRIGIASVKTKATATLAGLGTGSTTDTVNRPIFGVVADYAATKDRKFIAGMDFTRAKVNGETATLRVIFVGIRYLF